MSIIELPCFTPKEMHDFLTSNIPWHAWQSLSNMTPKYLEHIAYCTKCVWFFDDILFHLEQYGLISADYRAEAFKALIAIKEEIKLSVKVEVYKDTNLLDLSTLVNFSNIKLLVKPGIFNSGYPFFEFLEIKKIIIDNCEIDFRFINNQGDCLIFNHLPDLTQERLSEIVNQYEELIKNEIT